jgi:hypothetical protein
MRTFRGRVLLLAVALVALFVARAGTAPRADSATTATSTILKIAVDKDGFYRVPAATLTGLGFTPTVAANIHLRTSNAEVAYRYVGGNLEFYGQALDIPSTDTRVYFLSEEAGPGTQMQTIAAPGAANPPTGTFQASLNLRDRAAYYGGVVNGPANNFFGNFAVADILPPVNRPFSLSNADTTQASTLQVNLQGYADVGHNVSVTLNGNGLGAVTGSGLTPISNTLPVGPGILVNGNNANTIGMSTVSPGDRALTDQYTLTYRHFYLADNNVLDLPATPGTPLSFGGFSDGSIRVFDITTPNSARELTGTIGGGGGNFIFGTTVPVGATRLYAITDATVMAPKSVVADVANTLASPTNKADLLVLSYSTFMAAAQPLVNQRIAEGLDVDLIDIQEVFDGFGPNPGAHDPAGMTAFLQYAMSNWQNPKPKYVLLVGDASYDPRNYVGQGANDFIPTSFVTASFSPEPASDDAIADFNADGIPELAVGRLPVSSPAEAAAMVNKVVGYSASAPRPKSAILVADNFDRGDYHFDQFSDDLDNTSLTPNGVAVTKRYRPAGTGGDAALHASVLADATAGPILVNWFGHGSIQYWNGNPKILQSSDANSIGNSGKLSLYMMMTCQNAYFFIPGLDSLAEALLKAPNAAVAVWGSSGDTVPFDQVVAAKIATNALFSNASTRLGDAMLLAKAGIFDIDIRHTWILLGDPTTTLRFGTTTTVLVKSLAAKRTAKGVRLAWRTANESTTLGFNVYRGSGKSAVRVNRSLIAAKFAGKARGAAYSVVDTRAARGSKVAYRLQIVTLAGKRLWAARAVAAKR